MTVTSTVLRDAEQALFREVIRVVNQKNAPWPVTPGFENYWVTQQQDIRNDFRELAVRRRLSPEAAQLATQTLKDYTEVEPVVTVKAGRAKIAYVPKFKNLEASAAYMLLRLSGADDVAFGVCRKCGDLWFDDRPGKGRKREGFCTDAHRTAHTQAEYRKRVAKAARHK